MSIERVTVDRLSVPLSNPYHLSLGTVTDLDLVFVRIRTTDGTRGYGEAATLDGYFDVDIDTIWTESTTLAQRITKLTIDEAVEVITTGDQSLLARSALAAAMNGLIIDDTAPIRAPVVGIASAREGVGVAVDTVTEQVNDGHEIIKIKIGFDPETDAACLRTIVQNISDSVSLRVDANQGYSVDEARTFIQNCDTSQIELLEQPLPVGNLEAHAKLRADTTVPLMLDEELSDENSLLEIISTGAADMVKLKQMKQGGPAAVRSLAATARGSGLNVVLGNGVQSDVGCLQEAHLWDSLDLDTAGEFNGWHKQETSLIDPAPRLEDGMIVWDGGPISPDLETISAFSQGHYAAGE